MCPQFCASKTIAFNCMYLPQYIYIYSPNQLQLVKPSIFFNHHLLLSKCQKLKDLDLINKLCCQELKHASSLLELLLPPHCSEGMYALQSLMYKVQDYNMECHCSRLACTDEIWWLEVLLEALWTCALELPLLFYWWLKLLIFRLCIGSLRGTMPYKILSGEESGRIVGMCEVGIKSSDIAFVLNVPRSTISIILTISKVRRSVKYLQSWCGRHQKLSDRDARVLARYVRYDRRQPVSELSSLLNVNRNTTQLYLHQLGFRNYIAPKKTIS
jgi:hypothetical protein